MHSINLTGFQKKKKTKSNPVVNTMKIINLLVCTGFKTKALNILINALTLLKKQSKIDPLLELSRVLDKLCPVAELKTVKLGSTNYLVPTPLSKSRQLLLGLIF